MLHPLTEVGASLFLTFKAEKDGCDYCLSQLRSSFLKNCVFLPCPRLWWLEDGEVRFSGSNAGVPGLNGFWDRFGLHGFNQRNLLIQGPQCNLKQSETVSFTRREGPSDSGGSSTTPHPPEASHLLQGISYGLRTMGSCFEGGLSWCYSGLIGIPNWGPMLGTIGSTWY